MEHIELKLADEPLYDELVHQSLRQASDIRIVTKDSGTAAGKPVVVIAFDVQLPDGSIARAQATTTYGCLDMALAALRGRYGPGGSLELQARAKREAH